MSQDTIDQSLVRKVHLGFAPSRVSKSMPGLLIAFAIDEQRRYWGWFLTSKQSNLNPRLGTTEVRIVHDGDEFPTGYRHVGSEFETLEKGGLHAYHALSQR